MGKAAFQTCLSTYQDFWDTSEAMVVSPEATLYLFAMPRSKVLQCRGFWLKFERVLLCWFLETSVVKEVDWCARQLLRPAPAPTKTFGTLHCICLPRQGAPMLGVLAEI